MRKRLTKAEKWLFASPLLLLVVAWAGWQWQKSTSGWVKMPLHSQMRWVKFSPDGRRLLAFDDHTRGRIYDLEARSKVCDLETIQTRPTNLKPFDYTPPVWSPDGKSIAASTVHNWRSYISLWDATSGALKARHILPPTAFIGLTERTAYSPDGKTLIHQGDPSVVLDAASGKVLKVYSPPSTAKKLGLLKLNKYQPATSEIISFRIVDATTKQLLWQPKFNWLISEEWSNDVLCANYASVIGAGGRMSDGRLLLWYGKKRQQLMAPPVASGTSILGFRFNPDQKSIAYYYRVVGVTGENNHELLVWDYRQNRVLWRSRVVAGIALEWSPNGKWLVFFGNGYRRIGFSSRFRFMVFDATGKLHHEAATAATFSSWSPDETQLVTIGEQRNLLGNPVSRYLEIHRFED